jgi:TolB-like protein
MNQPLGPIDLAREADFALGGALVRPALRLFAMNGAREIVEPRVMQVLVALARRAGEVVGRDELVMTCWKGRIVGEDALQRAVAKVRKLGHASGAFAVETIPKVGYRLTTRTPEDERGSAARAADQPSSQAASLEQTSVLSPPQGARPVIAVLPFVARSGLATDEVFADAVVEDLTAALSTGQWVNVVAASAAAIYRRGARPLRQIGGELGARYLLEGNLRRIGDELRVAAQLIEAESENILWTQKFERPLAQLPALQEQLVAEIAAHVRVQVRRLETEHALRKHGRLSTWEAYLRSLSAGMFRYPTRSRYEASVAAASQAVEIDPNDGVAYATLASMQGQLLHHRGGQDAELPRKIVENIRHARALDPDNPIVLRGIAAALVGLRQVEEALPLAERAVAMTPDDDVARHMLGAIYARLGRVDEAMVELDAGDGLAPNGAWAYLSSLNRSIGRLLAGELDQALEVAESTARVLPGPELLVQTMLCLAKLDLWDAARETLRRLLDTDPEMSRAVLEGLVGSLYCAASAGSDHAALVCKVWDEMLSTPDASRPLERRD